MGGGDIGAVVAVVFVVVFVAVFVAGRVTSVIFVIIIIVVVVVVVLRKITDSRSLAPSPYMSYLVTITELRLNSLSDRQRRGAWLSMSQLEITAAPTADRQLF